MITASLGAVWVPVDGQWQFMVLAANAVVMMIRSQYSDQRDLQLIIDSGKCKYNMSTTVNEYAYPCTSACLRCLRKVVLI